MSRKSRLIMIIIIGVISWFIASRMGYVGKKKEPKKKVIVSTHKKVNTKPRIIMEKVVCAREDIKKGSPITSNSLIVKEFESSELKGLDTYKNLSSIEGMVALENIKSGDKILKSSVIDISKIKKLSYRVKPGLRAISLKISDPSNAISGLISQGEHVDVIAVYDNSRDVDNPFSKIIVQNVELMAIDKEYFMNESDAENSSSNKGKKSSQKASKNKIEGKKISVATLAVTPSQAEKLALVSERAKFFLILRSPFDEGKIKYSGISQHEILGFSRRDDLIKNKNAELTIKDINSKRDSIPIYRGTELINSDTPSNNSVTTD